MDDHEDDRAARDRHLAEAIEHLRAAGLQNIAERLREGGEDLLAGHGLDSQSEFDPHPDSNRLAQQVEELHKTLRELQDRVHGIGRLAQAVDDAHRRIDELRDQVDERMTQSRQPKRTGWDSHRTRRLLAMLQDELARRVEVVRNLRMEVLKKKKALAEDGYIVSSETSSSDDAGGQATELDNAQISELRKALIDTEVELQFLKTKLRVSKDRGQPEFAISEARINAVVENSQRVRDMRAEIEDARAAIVEMENLHRNPENTDRYRREKKNLAAAEESSTNLRAQLGADTREELMRKDRLAYDNTIGDLEREIHAKEVTRKILMAKVDEAQRDRGARGEQMLAFEFAKARLERENNIYEHIAARISELQAQIEADSNPDHHVHGKGSQ